MSRLKAFSELQCSRGRCAQWAWHGAVCHSSFSACNKAELPQQSPMQYFAGWKHCYSTLKMYVGEWEDFKAYLGTGVFTDRQGNFSLWLFFFILNCFGKCNESQKLEKAFLKKKKKHSVSHGFHCVFQSPCSNLARTQSPLPLQAVL